MGGAGMVDNKERLRRFYCKHYARHSVAVGTVYRYAMGHPTLTNIVALTMMLHREKLEDVVTRGNALLRSMKN